MLNYVKMACPQAVHCSTARTPGIRGRLAPTHRNKVDLWLLGTEPIRNYSVMDMVDLLIYGRLVCRRVLKYVGVPVHYKKRNLVFVYN